MATYVDELLAASYELCDLYTEMETRCALAGTDEREKLERILPGLRADLQDLQAEIKLVQEGKKIFPMPSAEQMKALCDATRSLANKDRHNETTSSLFSAATSLLELANRSMAASSAGSANPSGTAGEAGSGPA